MFLAIVLRIVVACIKGLIWTADYVDDNVWSWSHRKDGASGSDRPALPDLESQTSGQQQINKQNAALNMILKRSLGRYSRTENPWEEVKRIYWMPRHELLELFYRHADLYTRTQRMAEVNIASTTQPTTWLDAWDKVASALVLQDPRQPILKKLITESKVDAQLFGTRVMTPLPPSTTQQSSPTWWRLVGCMKQNTLMQFHDASDQLVSEASRDRYSTRGDTFDTTEQNTNLSFCTLDSRSLHLKRSIFNPELSLRKFRVLVLVDGLHIPSKAKADAYHRATLDPVQRWLFMFRLPFWHVVAAVWFIILLIDLWSWTVYFDMSYRESDRGQVVERTAVAEPMLERDIDSERMSLFLFLVQWVSDERNSDLVSAVGSVHGRSGVSNEYKRSVRAGLCARLNHDAWTSAITLLRAETTHLERVAIDQPNPSTLRRLTNCRALAADLKRQLVANTKAAVRRATMLDRIEAGDLKGAIIRANLEEFDARLRLHKLVGSEAPPLLRRMKSMDNIPPVNTIATSRSRARSWSFDKNHSPSDASSITRTDSIEAFARRWQQIHAQTTQSQQNYDSGQVADPDNPTAVLLSDNVASSYEKLLLEIDTLTSRLVETFQLLATGIQIQDSEIARKEAGRTTALTVIATIYLPASLAVGIFGMNV